MKQKHKRTGRGIVRRVEEDVQHPCFCAAAREVVGHFYAQRLSDRLGPWLRDAIERLARELPPHPDIADAQAWLKERYLQSTAEEG